MKDNGKTYEEHPELERALSAQPCSQSGRVAFCARTAAGPKTVRLDRRSTMAALIVILGEWGAFGRQKRLEREVSKVLLR